MKGSATKEQLNRLLTLLPYLLNHPRVPPDEVCRVFGIDRKTLEADLDLLWFCGLPPYDPFALIDVARDDESITVSSADYFARPVTLTAGEAHALASTLQILGTRYGAHKAGSLDGLLSKIEKALGRPAGGKRIEFATDGAADTRVFATLRRAVDERRSARIRYWSASRDETSERTVDPHRLVNVGGQWYVAAHCHSAGAQRLFRLDRVETAKLTARHFEPSAALSADVYDQGVLYRPSPDDETAVVTFLPAAARWAQEVWADCSQHQNEDGSVTVRIPYAHKPWMVRQILPYGENARILEPQGLIDEFLRTARALANQYASLA